MIHDPHAVLGVSADAGEAEIRARYLQLVREFPPDRAPERFAEIRAAYDQLRDPLRLLSRKIFALVTDDSLALLAGDLRQRLRGARPPLDKLLALADQP